MAEKTKGLSIEIGADTSKFSAAMKKLNQPINEAKRSLRAIDKALKLDPKNTGLIEQKMQALDKAVDGAKGKVDGIRAAMQKLESEGKVDTEQYRRLQRDLALAEAEYRKLTANAIKFKVEQSAIGRSAAWAQNMAPKLDAIGNKFMKLTKAAAGFALALGGIAIGKAFQKLESLEETRSIFVGLGKDADEVTAIMDDVTNSVAGTKYALADMAKVAKGALGGGADTKYGLANYLSRVGDLAAFTGGSVDQFGTIMNKALSKGTVDARLLNQMLAGGIPIYTDLASSMGVSADQLTKMIRAGKVGFDDLYKATEKYQGLATKTAMSTVGGAITILGQRWTNVGVAFLEGAYEPLRGGLIKLADLLAKNMDKVKEWGRAFGEAIKFLIKYAKTGEGDISALSDKAQKFAAVLKPLVGFVSGVVKAFMNLSSSGKKAVAFFALATGPILKLSAGMLRIYSRSADVVKGFTLMKQGGMTFAQTMAQCDNGVQKFGAAMGRVIPISGTMFTAIGAGVGIFAALGIAIGKHIQKLNESVTAYKKASQARAESIASVEAEGMLADSLFNKLQLLSQVENKSAEEKRQMKTIVDQLNGTLPGLGLVYDENTDKLNMSTDAIRKHIDEAKKMAKIDAYINAAKGAYEDYAKEHVNLTKKEEELREAKEKLATMTNTESGAYDKQKAKVNALSKEVENSKKALEGYNADAERYMQLADQDATATENFKQSQQELSAVVRGESAKLPTFARNALSATTAAFGNIGKQGGSKYASGMRGASGLAGAAGKVLSDNARAKAGTNLTSTGYNAGKGFANGIKNAAGLVATAASQLAAKAKETIEKKLGIKSPSRVFRDEIGKMVGAGFAEGIIASIPQVTKAANMMSAATVGAMSSVPINNSNSLANEVSGAVASGLMLNNNANVPENINVVVELGGAKVGETVVNLVKQTGTALYSEGVL